MLGYDMNKGAISNCRGFLLVILAAIICTVITLDILPPVPKYNVSVEPIQGHFITIDKSKLSMYITRITENQEKIPVICFIQQRFGGEFFENCVFKETIDDFITSHDGRITDINHYPDNIIK